MGGSHVQVRTLFLSLCTATEFSIIALLSYDYLLTLHKEVELFWNWRWTGATALFMVNRYLVMIIRLVNLVGFMPMSNQVRLSMYLDLYVMLTPMLRGERVMMSASAWNCTADVLRLGVRSQRRSLSVSLYSSIFRGLVRDILSWYLHDASLTIQPL